VKENWTVSQVDWSTVLPFLSAASQVIRFPHIAFAEITNGMLFKVSDIYYKFRQIKRSYYV
jgi:hypothetical protein